VRHEPAAETEVNENRHLGDKVTLRDLVDLSLVIDRALDELNAVAAFLIRHPAEFHRSTVRTSTLLRARFGATDALTYRPTTA